MSRKHTAVKQSWFLKCRARRARSRLFLVALIAASSVFASQAELALGSSATDCFRTAASGNWNATSTWESAPSPACSTWSAATLTPTTTAGTVTIRSPHTVALNVAASVDQFTIDSGGTLNISPNNTLTVADGTGTDLMVNGAITGGLTATNGQPDTIVINGQAVANGGAGADGDINISAAGRNRVTVNGSLSLFNDAVLTVNRNRNGDGVEIAGTASLADTSKITQTGTAANFSVVSGGILTLGPNALVNGNESFTLNNGGNLKIGSTGGISSSGATGNIQSTGTRTFPTNASYTYNGTAAQITGSGLPATVTSLTVDNSAGVTLTNSVTPTTLNLTAGIISTGANTVIMPAAGTVSRTNGYVFGNLRKNVATGTNVARTFEVGTSTAYNPVNVTFASVSTAGNLTVKANAGDHASIVTATGLNAAKSVNANWSAANAGIVFTNYSATFNFMAGQLDAGTDTNALIVGKLDSLLWSYPTVGTRTATSTQATGMTSFSDFQLAEAADTTPPETTIDSGPSDPSTSSSATFEFSSDDPNAAFECQLDSGGYESCSSPQTYSSLADGERTVSVRAIDAVGNTDQSPDTRTWTVDTTAPETSIDAGPFDPTNSTEATFEFSSDDPSATFECQLDGGSFDACSRARPTRA